MYGYIESFTRWEVSSVFLTVEPRGSHDFAIAYWGFFCPFFHAGWDFSDIGRRWLSIGQAVADDQTHNWRLALRPEQSPSRPPRLERSWTRRWAAVALGAALVQVRPALPQTAIPRPSGCQPPFGLLKLGSLPQ